MIQQIVSLNTPNISVLSTVLRATVQHIQYPSTYISIHLLYHICSNSISINLYNTSLLLFPEAFQGANRESRCSFLLRFSLWPRRFNLYFLLVPCVFCYLSPCLFIPSVCCSLPRLRQISRLFVIEAERDCSFESGLEKYRGSNDAANETCVRGERELRKSAVEIAPNHPPDRGKNFPSLLWGS